MNIIIEDAETLQYLANPGQWTKKVAEGKRFGTTEIAYKAAKLESIGKFNIVCYIAQTEQFINLDHGKGRGLGETGPILEDAPLVTPEAVSVSQP